MFDAPVKSETSMLYPTGEVPLKGEDIICFSHDWSGDPLSKTHIVRILSRDNRILWINSLANRAPTIAKKDFARVFSKLKRFTEPIVEVERNIFILNPLAFPAYGTSMVRSFNQSFLLAQVRRAMSELGFKKPVNLVFNPAAGLVAGRIGERRLIYYCVDEYTAFTGASKGLKEIEADLFRKSDVVIVSAEKLLEDKKHFNKKTFLIRHGTDWRHFRTALDSATVLPSEVKDLPRPIIGFHGLLADWVDFELIKKVAQKFSDGSVVLIGKVTVEAESKIKVLDGLTNVHRLGRKPYAQLPAYCKSFDVALNPFVINELTLAANPLKVREYLAAGVVTVSTDIPEVRQLKDCLVGSSYEEFLNAIDLALGYARSSMQISDEIADESWDAKVDELRQILASCD